MKLFLFYWKWYGLVWLWIKFEYLDLFSPIIYNLVHKRSFLGIKYDLTKMTNLYILQMERTLRVSLTMCPLHKILIKKIQKHLIPKVEKKFTNQHNTPGPTKTCHITLFKSQFFLSLIPFSPFSLWNPNGNPFALASLLFLYSFSPFWQLCHSYGTSEGFSVSQLTQKQCL